MATKRSFGIFLSNILGFIGIYLLTFTLGKDSYTNQEKVLITIFRERVKDGLTQRVMFEDKYLIRFLQAKDYDLDQAEKMLRDMLEWRKRENMNNVFNEDWADWEKRYPYHFQSHDKDGRPAMTTHIGQIDVRRLVLAGRKQQLDRYLMYGYERGLYNLHRVSNETGKEFMSGYLLFNMNGFSPRSHACIACLDSWARLVINYEKYYPRLCKEIYAINVPKIFKIVFDVMLPFLSGHTLEHLHVYGIDKSEWKHELLKVFPEKELTKEFGGTREDSY